MKNFFLTKSMCTLLYSILLIVFSSQLLHSVESPKDKISKWIKSSPWIGLIAKEVTFGPVTLKNLNLDGKGRLVFAKPGEEIKAVVKYKVNAEGLDSWGLHHIIVGIMNQDATCITHSLGIWDKKGETSFMIQAPKEKGLYEVRFDYQEALFCGEAIETWQKDSPSAQATVGIIIVE